MYVEDRSYGNLQYFEPCRLIILIKSNNLIVYELLNTFKIYKRIITFIFLKFRLNTKQYVF